VAPSRERVKAAIAQVKATQLARGARLKMMNLKSAENDAREELDSSRSSPPRENLSSASKTTLEISTPVPPSTVSSTDSNVEIRVIEQRNSNSTQPPPSPSPSQRYADDKKAPTTNEQGASATAIPASLSKDDDSVQEENPADAETLAKVGEYIDTLNHLHKDRAVTTASSDEENTGPLNAEDTIRHLQALLSDDDDEQQHDPKTLAEFSDYIDALQKPQATAIDEGLEMVKSLSSDELEMQSLPQEMMVQVGAYIDRLSRLKRTRLERNNADLSVTNKGSADSDNSSPANLKVNTTTMMGHYLEEISADRFKSPEEKQAMREIRSVLIPNDCPGVSTQDMSPETTQDLSPETLDLISAYVDNLAGKASLVKKESPVKKPLPKDSGTVQDFAVGDDSSIEKLQRTNETSPEGEDFGTSNPPVAVLGTTKKQSDESRSQGKSVDETVVSVKKNAGPFPIRTSSDDQNRATSIFSSAKAKSAREKRMSPEEMRNAGTLINRLLSRNPAAAAPEPAQTPISSSDEDDNTDKKPLIQRPQKKIPVAASPTPEPLKVAASDKEDTMSMIDNEQTPAQTSGKAVVDEKKVATAESTPTGVNLPFDDKSTAKLNRPEEMRIRKDPPTMSSVRKDPPIDKPMSSVAAGTARDDTPEENPLRSTIFMKKDVASLESKVRDPAPDVTLRTGVSGEFTRREEPHLASVVIDGIESGRSLGSKSAAVADQSRPEELTLPVAGDSEAREQDILVAAVEPEASSVVDETSRILDNEADAKVTATDQGPTEGQTFSTAAECSIVTPELSAVRSPGLDTHEGPGEKKEDNERRAIESVDFDFENRLLVDPAETSEVWPDSRLEEESSHFSEALLRVYASLVISKDPSTGEIEQFSHLVHYAFPFLDAKQPTPVEAANIRQEARHIGLSLQLVDRFLTAAEQQSSDGSSQIRPDGIEEFNNDEAIEKFLGRLQGSRAEESSPPLSESIIDAAAAEAGDEEDCNPNCAVKDKVGAEIPIERGNCVPSLASDDGPWWIAAARLAAFSSERREAKDSINENVVSFEEDFIYSGESEEGCPDTNSADEAAKIHAKKSNSVEHDINSFWENSAENNKVRRLQRGRTRLPGRGATRFSNAKKTPARHESVEDQWIRRRSMATWSTHNQWKHEQWLAPKQLKVIEVDDPREINGVEAAETLSCPAFRRNTRKGCPGTDQWRLPYKERTSAHPGYFNVDVYSLYNSTDALTQIHRLDSKPWENREVKQLFLYEQSIAFCRNWFGRFREMEGIRVRQPVAHPKSMEMPMRVNEWSEDWYTPPWADPLSSNLSGSVSQPSRRHKVGRRLLGPYRDPGEEDSYTSWGEIPECGTIKNVKLKIGERISRVTPDLTSSLRRSRWRKKHFPKGTFPY
jgi:hypothetical protein